MPRHEALEALVPAVLAGVEDAVALDEPAEVAGLAAADRRRPVALDRSAQPAHRRDRALGVGERVEQLRDLVPRAFVQALERLRAVGRELDLLATGVAGEASRCEQALLLEALYEPAQLSGVDRQRRP